MSATRSAAEEMTVAEREDQRDKTILLVVCEELVPWTVQEIGRGCPGRRGTSVAARV